MSLLFANDQSAWSSDEAAVDLGDVETISNDFIIYPDYRSKKTEVSAAKLTDIQGALTIQPADTSNTIEQLDVSFPALQHVGKDYVVTGKFGDISITHEKDVQVEGMFRVTGIEAKKLEVDGVSEVKKDFSIDSNSDLQELVVKALATAGAGFSIQEHSSLETLSLPKLKEVKGDMVFYHNAKLTEFECSALESAQTISWTSNGDKASISFPKLSSLGNATTTATSEFKDLAMVQLPALREVQGALTFSSTSVEELVVPLVKSINGSITVEDNPSMTVCALPRATSVSEISISGNDALTNFTANALKSAGTISLKGSFTNVEFFGLEEVTGDFKVVGDDDMDCSWFDENLKKIVKGKYTCVGNHDEPKTARKSSTGGIENTEGNAADYVVPLKVDGSSDDDSDGGDSSGDGSKMETKSAKKGLSTGAKAGIAIGAVAGAALIVLAIFFGLRAWKKRQAAAKPAAKNMGNHGDESGSNSDLGVYDGKKMGVHTTIEASSPEPHAMPNPIVGALEFARSPFLESTDASGNQTWKTIRRVSDSSGLSRLTGMSRTTRDG